MEGNDRASTFFDSLGRKRNLCLINSSPNVLRDFGRDMEAEPTSPVFPGAGSRIEAIHRREEPGATARAGAETTHLTAGGRETVSINLLVLGLWGQNLITRGAKMLM